MSIVVFNSIIETNCQRALKDGQTYIDEARDKYFKGIDDLEEASASIRSNYKKRISSLIRRFHSDKKHFQEPFLEYARKITNKMLDVMRFYLYMSLESLNSFPPVFINMTSLLGEGSGGKVCPGILPDQTRVAVKVNHVSKRSFRELKREYEFLSCAQEVSGVVKILSKIELEERNICALVLEYCESSLFDLIKTKYTKGCPLVAVSIIGKKILRSLKELADIEKLHLHVLLKLYIDELSTINLEKKLKKEED